MCEWHSFTLLRDIETYNPDTLDLSNDAKAAEYWFQCFRELIEKFANQAALSHIEDDISAEQRAQQFRTSYLEALEDMRSRVETNKFQSPLSIRQLLQLNEDTLRRFGFHDPWMWEKQKENDLAVKLLKERLEEIDAIENLDQRWIELVRGVLAGNMFDWGAQAVANILKQDNSFGLHAALDRIEKRPWLFDNLDAWIERLLLKKPHKCAAIFVDNSGVDIVLGILPFARELLKRGTKVLLCANDEPTLNDVTSGELHAIIDRCCKYCDILAKASSSFQLLVYGNGQRGPCLDMRTLPQELCRALTDNETDLLVIEGMGRALHTNLYARFNCETLKLAVIKNQWLANRLGGDIFAVMCKYER